MAQKNNGGENSDFEGVSGKTWSGTWCFDGEFVVRCVADVVFWMVSFRGSKNVPVFRDLFFQAEIGRLATSFCGLRVRAKVTRRRRVSLRRRVIVLRLG
jgi:hypothetical protein